MIGLIDSTLREGEQMSGVYFSLQQKLDIIKRLASIGIEEIELGVAAMSPEMPELIIHARRTAPSTRLALWSRGLISDIRESAELYPDVLSITLPVSDIHISRRLGKDRTWLLNQIAVVIEEARKNGISFVSLGLEDATRADPLFLNKVLRQAEMAGADRVRLSDTLGLASPMLMTKLVQSVKKRVTMQVGVHTHNDFGMASANAISALSAGADWADVTILGIGERAGNARLEEVAGYFSLNKQRCPYNTKLLSETCQEVARMIDLPISPIHPIIGKNIFACESGIHLDGLAKDPNIYEPYPPELVKAVRSVLLGKKAGRNAVFTQLRALGLAITREDSMQITQRVRSASQQLGRPLTNYELEQLVDSRV